MESHTIHFSWAETNVKVDRATGNITVSFHNKPNAIKMRVAEIFVDGESVGDTGIFTEFVDKRNNRGGISRTLHYTGENPALPEMDLILQLTMQGFQIHLKAEKECSVRLEADLSWGDCENTYAASTGSKNGVFRSALGPVATKNDDMLFDRLTDHALIFKGNFRIRYNRERNRYTLSVLVGTGCEPFRADDKTDFLGSLYQMPYKPINRNSTFSAPPVGFMTWYSVKFDACEDVVLRNAKWLSENLKDYGANSIWVDWEWCHKDMAGRRDDGASMLSPDKEKYPNGLDHVASEIKKLGLTPCLWIGFVVESDKIDFIKENPDAVLVEYKQWCGSYFLDFSHPKYLNELLPKAISNVKKWGYEAVKFDCLPMAMTMHDRYHDRMYDPSLTTREAYRNVIKKARQELGENFYMLFCSGAGDWCILPSADVFDSARIGEDIFKWDSFMAEGVEKALRYYPLHNNVMYMDPDNVVMREEFSTPAQAASRIYFISMLGMPVTFGDEFSALDEQRIGFIKSCLPVLDIHPKDMEIQTLNGDLVKMNLAIAKPWEQYNVVNLFNASEESRTVTVDLANELELDEGWYFVFDYVDNKLLTITDSAFTAELAPCTSKIFAVRKVLDRPQVISTSRHISQGAAEIQNMVWQDSRLTITADLIADAPYTVTVYVPDGYTPVDMEKISENIYRKTTLSPTTQTCDIELMFQ
jgi:hypothetical protein